jgi:hypothetical protein
MSLVVAGERLGLDAHTLSDLEHGREVTLQVRTAVATVLSDREMTPVSPATAGT